jgi:hypothetical protein
MTVSPQASKGSNSQVELVMRFLALVHNVELDGITDIDEFAELPSDVYGQLLWRFPALRDKKLFHAAFSITQSEAVCEVQRTFSYGARPGLNLKQSWTIWSLAMVLALAFKKLGSLKAVNDWLEGASSKFTISAIDHLGSPIGRELICEGLRRLP